MADSIIIPVEVDVHANTSQLNNIQQSISRVFSNGGKAADFFKPMVSGANKLNASLVKSQIATKGMSAAMKGLGGIFKTGFNGILGSFKIFPALLKATASGIKGVFSLLYSGASKAESPIKSLFKSFLGLASLAGLAKLGKDMVKLSSDLIEVQNVVDTVFGDMSENINEFAQNALFSFGLTELQAKKFASTTGAIVKATGLSKEATLEMAEGITKLTGDVASFYNLDHETAFNKLKSGITGETEPLKSLGVVMTEANLEAFRLSQGIETSYKAMDQAQKTALRYNFILSTLADAQGDFSKTQGSWSNQVRILQGQVQQLGAILGGFIQNVLYPVLTVLNQIISYAIIGAQALAKMFGFDISGVQAKQGISGGGGGVDLGDTGAEEMDDLASSTDKATASQKKLNKEQKKGLANIHDLNVLQSKSDSGSGGGAGGGAGGFGGLDFDLLDYKKIEGDQNPIQKLFDDLSNAVKNNDWYGVGALLGKGINAIFSSIDIASAIPKVAKVVENFAQILNGLVNTVDFKEIGRVVGEGLNLIVTAVNTFYDKFDFKLLGIKIGAGLNGLIDTVDFAAVGKFFTNKFNAVFQTLAGFVSAFDWGSLGKNLSAGINSIVTNLDLDSFASAVSGFINGIVNTIGTMFLNVDLSEAGAKLASSVSKLFTDIDYGAILVSALLGLENVVNGIATYLANIDFGAIFGKLADGLNKGIWQIGNIDFGGIAKKLSTGVINMLKSLNSAIKNVDWFALGKNLYEGFKSAILNINWGELLKQLVIGFVYIIGALGTTLTTMIMDLFIDLGFLFAGAIDSLAGFIDDITAKVGEFIVNMFVAVGEFFANILTSIGQFFANAWANIVTWFTNLVTNIGTWLGNIITSIATWFTGLISNLASWLSNIGSSIASWFTGVVSSIGTYLGNAMSTLSNWFTSLPGKVWEWLTSVGSKISEWFTNTISSVKDAFGEILSYIGGAFKSGWETAWNAVSSVCTGIFDAIGGAFKGVINVVIDAINAVIGAINKLSFDVPSWVPGIGGSTFGFNFDKIPRLASGAVIPPNNEFLAVLGDQKRGMNIETPLDTMLQAFRYALAEGNFGGDGDIIIPIYINNELSSEEIVRRQDIERYRSNGK